MKVLLPVFSISFTLISIHAEIDPSWIRPHDWGDSDPGNEVAASVSNKSTDPQEKAVTIFYKKLVRNIFNHQEVMYDENSKQYLRLVKFVLTEEQLDNLHSTEDVYTLDSVVSQILSLSKTLKHTEKVNESFVAGIRRILGSTEFRFILVAVCASGALWYIYTTVREMFTVGTIVWTANTVVMWALNWAVVSYESFCKSNQEMTQLPPNDRKAETISGGNTSGKIKLSKLKQVVCKPGEFIFNNFDEIVEYVKALDKGTICVIIFILLAIIVCSLKVLKITKGKRQPQGVAELHENALGSQKNQQRMAQIDEEPHGNELGRQKNQERPAQIIHAEPHGNVLGSQKNQQRPVQTDAEPHASIGKNTTQLNLSIVQNSQEAKSNTLEHSGVQLIVNIPPGNIQNYKPRKHVPGSSNVRVDNPDVDDNELKVDAAKDKVQSDEQETDHSDAENKIKVN